MSDALDQRLILAIKNTMKPKSKMTLVEWSDKYRYLSSVSSSLPGRWKTSRVEVAREPMLAVTDPSVRKITIMACSQLFKTELLNNVIAYFISQDPAPMIMLQPTGSMAEAYSKDRLDPMIKDTPILNELVEKKKSRQNGNTIAHKTFPGGQLSIIGSNSPSELASRPVRVTLRDEIDRYPDSAGNEGDPSALIIERSATFFNSLDIGTSTPTIKGRSKIESEYLLSDRRVYHVNCPHCGFKQPLEFKYVRWQNNDCETAQYQCVECTTLWTEPERLNAISGGSYVATAPFRGHAGFYCNKIASPWEPLSVLVRKWLDAQGDTEKLKTFLNTQLGETWEERGEAPEHMRLYERRAHYQINTLPEGVIFLTAGADVQKDRIELEIVGYGKGKESWSIDYRVIMGETSTQAPWIELDKVLNETWTSFSGQNLIIKTLAIDSGYNTQYVYSWARKYTSNRVMVVKGQDSQQNILGSPQAADITHGGSKLKRGIRVWPVGVSTLKSELYGFLNLNGAGDDGIFPPGFCHFPQYDEHYFKMLTAEQLMKRNVNGKTVYRWVKSYERNEALDCRNYARAAASMIGMDRFKDQDWLNLMGYQPTAIKEIPAQSKPEVKKEIKKQNDYWSGQKKSFW